MRLEPLKALVETSEQRNQRDDPDCPLGHPTLTEVQRKGDETVGSKVQNLVVDTASQLLLLSRHGVAPRQFVADLAVYFIVCNGLALVLIGLGGGTDVGRVGLVLACWLPGGLLGNALGNTWAGRVPQGPFRQMTLGLVVVTGLATVVSALVG